jgi:hypothetical protein
MKDPLISTRPWNTVAERNILMDLMELLLKAMEEDNGTNVGNLDDSLMVFSTNRTTYNTHSPIQVACRQRPRLRYALSHFEPIVCRAL